MQDIKLSFGFSGSSTSNSQKITDRGYITDVAVATPNFTNAVTTTITVLDPDGKLLGTIISAKARNSFEMVHLTNPIPVGTNYEIKTELSGAAGGSGGTVGARLFINQ